MRSYFISWFTRDKHVCDNLFLQARLINICFIINNNHTTINSSLHSWWRGSRKPRENFLHANKRSDLLNTVTVNHFFIRCDFILWSTGDKLFTKTRFCDQWLPYSYNNARNICDDEASMNLTQISCMWIKAVLQRIIITGPVT